MLVLPSRTFEMCPLSILEAMSHGLPVIASRLGGQAELVDDGVTGLLFTPGDADDLAKKIKLLWDNPELCRRLGRAGYERVVNEYREDVYFRRLMAVYRQAIEQHGSKANAVESPSGVLQLQGESPSWEQPLSIESE
jgi:glycosyltransferase involved in cell wall biosynthesis